MAIDQWFENTENLSIPRIVGLEGQYRTDSLICAIEAIVLEKDEQEDAEISPGELTVLAIEAMEREVNNGGFVQFFTNSSWRFTPYLSESLARIGAPNTKALVDRAIDALGIGLLADSADPSDYYSRMQDAAETDEVNETLSTVDSEYFTLEEDIADLLFQYVKKNTDEFA